MPANQYGFSLAEAMRDGEAIKSDRIGNELNRLKLDDHKAQRERNAMLQPIRQQAASGDSDAQKQILALDPENGPAFVKSVHEADKARREQMQANVEQYGAQSHTILEALKKDPDAAMGMYKGWYQSAPPEFRKTMPRTNIQAWLEQSVAKATAMHNLLAGYDTHDLGNKQLLTKGTDIVREVDKPKSAAEIKASRELSGVPDKEIKTIASLIAKTYGGDWTRNPETGDLVYQGLSDDDSRNAMAATTRAVQIRRETGLDQAAAAQQAMEELGMVFPKGKRSGAAVEDPAPKVPAPSGQKTSTSKFKIVNGEIVPL